MDANAKVVAWQWQGGDGQWRECTFHGREEYMRAGYDVRELVTLTDHEAALAELAEQIVEGKRQWDRVAKALGADGDCVDDVFRKADAQATLLTGLEALAGELESEAKTLAPDDCEGDRTDDVLESCAQRIRTLTNSSKA